MNWAIFNLEKIHLAKNFFGDIENYLNWDKVDECLFRNDVIWELIDSNGQKEQDRILYVDWYGPVRNRLHLVNSINDGKTFVIVLYGMINRKNNELCESIENHFNLATDLHVYGSIGKSKAFDPHVDTTHNFIVQAYGKTRWMLYDDNDQKIFDEYLHPTDVLFIPRGVRHCAVPEEKRLSLSIPMREKTLPLIPRNISMIDK